MKQKILKYIARKVGIIYGWYLKKFKPKQYERIQYVRGQIYDDIVDCDMCLAETKSEISHMGTYFKHRREIMDAMSKVTSLDKHYDQNSTVTDANKSNKDQ